MFNQADSHSSIQDPSIEGLSSRSSLLLNDLVQFYLETGKPISSKKMATESGFGLSSATIRNLMADLEERGYVSSLHASSGRIPTIQGLRFFVNRLLSVATPVQSSEENVIALSSEEREGDRSKKLIGKASNVLSQLTNMVGIVSLPILEQHRLKHIELVSLAGRRLLVILVLNEGDVQNRIIQAQRIYTSAELNQMSAFLNTRYAGKELMEIHRQLSEMLEQERVDLNDWMKAAIQMASTVLESEQHAGDFVVAGQHYLFSTVSPLEKDQLRNLFTAFTEKQEILQLLNQCIAASGVQIFIGEEAHSDALQGYSVVAKRYGVEHQPLGVLGVIGPTCMRYEQAIQVVELTANSLTSALKSVHESPYTNP